MFLHRTWCLNIILQIAVNPGGGEEENLSKLFERNGYLSV